VGILPGIELRDVRDERDLCLLAADSQPGYRSQSVTYCQKAVPAMK